MKLFLNFLIDDIQPFITRRCLLRMSLSDVFTDEKWGNWTLTHMFLVSTNAWTTGVSHFISCVTQSWQQYVELQRDESGKLSQFTRLFILKKKNVGLGFKYVTFHLQITKSLFFLNLFFNFGLCFRLTHVGKKAFICAISHKKGLKKKRGGK